MNIVKGLYQKIPQNIRTFFGKRWFEYVSNVNLGSDLNFMNYGYASLNPGDDELKLDAIYEQDRWQAQLYHYVAKNVDWTNVNALEIGCGRGGGAAFLAGHFKPSSYTGLDITSSAIEFCNDHYSVDGLHFEVGDAENLRFEDDSMDVILNMESSGNYPNIDNFFAEVSRVLKPNGYFLYADFRGESEMEVWKNQLNSMGLELLKEENISANVLRAMEFSEEKKRGLIRNYVPKFLHRITEEFAGMKGSNYIYDALEKGEKVYMGYAFRQPVA